MNGFYITGLDDKYQGGLFHATYERIIRHSKKLNELSIINNNFYIREENEYNFEKLQIINLNYKRTISYMIDKLFTDRQEKRLISLYISKFDSLLSKSDFIHAHWGWPYGYVAYRLSNIYSIPYYITLHGSDINNMKKRNKKNMLKAMENASKCFFVSNYLLNKAIELGYKGENSVVNYNGVNLCEFLLKNKRTYKIGYIGALIKIKGADLLPSIFKRINAEEKRVSFQVIGEGPLKQQINNAVRKTDLSSKIEFLGHVRKHDIPKLMRDLDLLIVPSRNEGLGMVILEANACGVPVIGSNRGGIPEAIGDEENCFELDESFIDKIASRAIDILKDNNYERNGIKLRKRIEKKFTWERIVKKEFEIYKKDKIDYKST